MTFLFIINRHFRPYAVARCHISKHICNLVPICRLISFTNRCLDTMCIAENGDALNVKGNRTFWIVLLFNSIYEIQKVIRYVEIILQELNDITNSICQTKCFVFDVSEQTTGNIIRCIKIQSNLVNNSWQKIMIDTLYMCTTYRKNVKLEMHQWKRRYQI